jgi:hypothetical protein
MVMTTDGKALVANGGTVGVADPFFVEGPNGSIEGYLCEAILTDGRSSWNDTVYLMAGCRIWPAIWCFADERAVRGWLRHMATVAAEDAERRRAVVESSD